MEKYIYTKREVQIIKTRRPLAISDEEFLSLFHKAFIRDNYTHINHLEDIYPEIAERVFSNDFIEKHENLADYEGKYIFPILCPTNRYTEGRIRDMVCYLTSAADWSGLLHRQLSTTIPYRLVFNYWLYEYVKDYDSVALWDSFFLGQDKLSKILRLRRITALDELAYRAMEYFDQHLPSANAK